MKNVKKLFGIILLVAIIGFSMVACDNGNGDNDDPISVTYTSYDTDGNK